MKSNLRTAYYYYIYIQSTEHDQLLAGDHFSGHTTLYLGPAQGREIKEGEEEEEELACVHALATGPFLLHTVLFMLYSPSMKYFSSSMTRRGSWLSMDIRTYIRHHD